MQYRLKKYEDLLHTTRVRMEKLSLIIKEHFPAVKFGGCGVFTYLVNKYLNLNHFVMSIHDTTDDNILEERYRKIRKNEIVKFSHLMLQTGFNEIYDQYGFDELYNHHYYMPATDQYLLKCVNTNIWNDTFNRGTIPQINETIADTLQMERKQIDEIKIWF